MSKGTGHTHPLHPKRLKHHIRHRVQTKRARKAARTEHLLVPEFMVHTRTSRQELIAGIVLGIVAISFVWSVVVYGLPGLLHVFKSNTSSPKTTVVKTSAPIVTSGEFLQVTLNRWSYTNGGPTFKPYVGFRFVVVDVQLIQKHTQPVWLAPALQSYVMDATGQQYKLIPDDGIAHPFVAKAYDPGKTAAGQLAYEIPNQAAGLRWCYDLSTGTAHPTPVCVALP
jgi:hypothetical protein